MKVGDEEPLSSTSGRSRQWIYDRVNGMSRSGTSIPHNFLCYPSPILKFCPFLCEENCICTTFGWIGCFDPADKLARKLCLRIGFALNIAGLVLMVCAALSLSDSIGLLKLSSYNRGFLTSKSGLWIEPVYIHVGLRAIVFQNPNVALGQTEGEEKIIYFSEFCSLLDRGLRQYYEDPVNDCSTCDDATWYLVVSVLISAVTFVPAIAVNVSRMSSGYDMNCQKVWSSVVSLLSVAASTMAFIYYTQYCFSAFRRGDVAYDFNTTVVDIRDPTEAEKAAIVVNFDWKWGAGLYCLVIGTAFKVIDIITNCCISTPTITRDLQEQKDYEFIRYRN